MSTLTVLLPPREANQAPEAWQLPALRFLLADRRGRTLRTGVAPLALLPKAAATVLIVAARDVLLLDAVVPPLAGPRLRQALPNIIEDQLLADGPPPHIALGPAAAAGRKVASRRTVAAIDRGWLRYLHESFTAAGHRGIRAVPIVACLPMVAAPDEALLAARALGEKKADDAEAAAPEASEDLDSLDEDARAKDSAARAVEAAELAETHALAASATVLIVDAHGSTPMADQALLDAMSDGETHGVPLSLETSDDLAQTVVEVAIRRLPVPPIADTVPIADRLAGEGLAVPADALIDTLAALLPGGNADAVGADVLRGREIYRLEAVESTNTGVSRTLNRLGITARSIDWETLAQAARDADFDLCQFEFASQPWRLRAGTLRRARIPIALLVASVVVAIAGINVQWAQLARERDTINARMTELLLDAFPRTTVVLDPPRQMARSLDGLRVAAGELSPDDFLTLSNRLSASLGAIPPKAIESLDYDRQALQLTFRSDSKVDATFRERLARNGLDGSFDGKRWLIRSSR